MLLSIVQFAALTALIVAVANYMLYLPAKRISDRLAFSPNASGQMLGYLTSAPELVASIAVASAGLMTAVAYNILSSNIINVILAVAAATWYRQGRSLFTRSMWREHVIIAASILVPVLLLATGQVESAWTIPLFIAAYVAYLAAIRSITNANCSPSDGSQAQGPSAGATQTIAQPKTSKARCIAVNAGIIAAALIALYLLGTSLGSTVHELGTTFGVPEIILGAVIGVVTSLPELTTFFASYGWHRRNDSRHGSYEVAHNLLASNVSNLLIVQTIGLVAFLLLAT